MPEITTADRLSEAIRLIESVVTESRGQGFGSRDLSNPELVEVTGLGEQAGRLIDSLRAEVAHEIDARTSRKAPADPKDSLAHSYGFGSSFEFLQRLTLTSRGVIAQRLRIGKACRTQVSLLGEELPGRFSHVGDAFFNGEISIETAEVITRGLGKLPSSVPYDHITLAERNLVSHATGTELNPGVWEDAGNSSLAGAPGIPTHTKNIEELTKGWVAALDQDGNLPREELLSRRFVRFGNERQGLVPIHGALLPDVAAMFRRIMDAIHNPRATDITTPYRPDQGADQPGADQLSPQHESETRTSRVRFVPADEAGNVEPRDTRTRDEKQHDALATIFGIAMKHADMPSNNGEALTLTIQVTDTDLERRGGTAWVTDGQGGLTPLDTGAARHASCVGSVLRVSQDDNGRIVNLETSARIFNAHQRRAIMLRDGGCIMPDCTQTATWCEVHHVEEWSKNPTTHTDNGVLLCWYHHRHIETHQWSIRMRDGVPEIMAPPWLDPDRQWRKARSVHKPPKLPSRDAAPQRRTHSPAPAISTHSSACEVRTSSCIPAPRLARPTRTLDFTWARISITIPAAT